MTEVRERRIQIGLFELDEEFNKKGKKPLCELQSFQTTFSLNEIPQAQVVPLLGDNIQTASKQIPFKTLYTLATQSAPVGVYIYFIHKTRSKGSTSDNQYWPKKSVCIFKGYLGAPKFDITAYEAGVAFTIHHWLMAIANISLLTTASSVHNPDGVSIAAYGLQQGVAQVWGSFFIDKELNVNKIWETGIKKIFTQVLDWGEENGNSDKLNPFVQRERKRMRLILDKIESSGTELNKNLENGLQVLNTIVDRVIHNDTFPSYINTCGWTKLLRVFAPMFLFSIVPTVDKALIIPTPCTIDPKQAIEIKEDEIFNLSTVPYVAQQVGRVVCTADIGTTNANTPVGQPYYVAYGIYPPVGVLREGLIHTVAFPGWLSSVAITPVDQKLMSVYENIQQKANAVIKRREELKKLAESQKTISQAYAAHAYLVQHLSGTTASVALPLRMDICPGAMVKILAKGTKGYVLLYGTVYSVQVSMTAGTTPSTTVLQLTNIRTEVSINDVVDNPSEGSGYYNSQWSGNGFVLYSTAKGNKKESKKNEDKDDDSWLDEIPAWAKKDENKQDKE